MAKLEGLIVIGGYWRWHEVEEIQQADNLHLIAFYRGEWRKCKSFRLTTPAKGGK